LPDSNLEECGKIQVNKQYLLIVERLTRMPHVQKVESLNLKGRPNITQHYKRFVTASAFMQVVVLSSRYESKMGTANSLQASV